MEESRPDNKLTMNKSHKRLLFALTAVGVLAIGAFAMTDKTWLGVRAETTTYRLFLGLNSTYRYPLSDNGTITAKTNPLGNTVCFSSTNLSSASPSATYALYMGKAGSSLQNKDPITGLTQVCIYGFAKDGDGVETDFARPTLTLSAAADFSSQTTTSLDFEKNDNTYTYDGNTIHLYGVYYQVTDVSARYVKLNFQDSRVWVIDYIIFSYTCAVQATVNSASSGGAEQTTSHISGQPLSLP